MDVPGRKLRERAQDLGFLGVLYQHHIHNISDALVPKRLFDIHTEARHLRMS